MSVLTLHILHPRLTLGVQLILSVRFEWNNIYIQITQIEKSPPFEKFHSNLAIGVPEYIEAKNSITLYLM